jgi:hypothetical protein
MTAATIFYKRRYRSPSRLDDAAKDDDWMTSSVETMEPKTRSVRVTRTGELVSNSGVSFGDGVSFGVC